MNAFIACWRAIRVLACAAGGLAQIMVLFPRLSQPQRNLRVQAWAGVMLLRLGVELRVSGTPTDSGPMLLVANHISWLDIVVMHAARHCRFVAKSEIRHWPVVGMLATGGGTLYVERESPRDVMRVVHHMAQALKNGDILAVFPEGTTGNGLSVMPFHANLIQAAVSAHVPVQPVALQFRDRRTGAISQAASYIGEESLIGSLWRTLGARGLVAVVRFGVPQDAAGRDRRTWAKDLRLAVDGLRCTEVQEMPTR